MLLSDEIIFSLVLRVKCVTIEYRDIIIKTRAHGPLTLVSDLWVCAHHQYATQSHIERRSHGLREIAKLAVMFGGCDWFLWGPVAAAFVIIAYLVRVNQQLSGTPVEVKRLGGSRWTPELLEKTYERLQHEPIEYAHMLPPRLDRRYVVTGGSGEWLFPSLE